MSEVLGDLVERATGGDRRALAELCKRLQGPVYRLALRMLGSVDDAQDATQEVLVQAITHLSTFERRSELMTWVYTIAVRHLLRVRARPKETALSPEALAERLDQGLAMAERTPALNATDAPVLERELELECTHGMFLVLSRPERIAYILADVLGATDRIGAEICEITTAAFRQRLARARAQMRPLLAERCGLADERNPCRCQKQARPAVAVGLIRSDRLRFAKHDAELAPELARADEQLGQLRRMGHVFDRGSPLAPPASVWSRLVDAFPDLLS
jgi:RNA polymerase sigma factor (sigma-70 family)